MLTKTHGLIAICQIFVAFSVLYLVVGMIKPKWVWLGDKEPSRQIIAAIALVAFMASWTGYSSLTLKPREQLEAERREALLQAQTTPPESGTAEPAASVAAPVAAAAAVAATAAVAAKAAAKPHAAVAPPSKPQAHAVVAPKKPEAHAKKKAEAKKKAQQQ